MIFTIGLVLFILAVILANCFPYLNQMIEISIALTGIIGLTMVVVSLLVVTWKYLP